VSHDWVVRGTDIALLRQYEEEVSEFELLDILRLPLCRDLQEFGNREPIDGSKRVRKVVHRDQGTDFVVKEFSKRVTTVPFDDQALFFRDLEVSACFRDEGRPVMVRNHNCDTIHREWKPPRTFRTKAQRI
jgi:hypothetical protein